MGLLQSFPSSFFFTATVRLLRATSFVSGSPGSYGTDSSAGRQDALVSVPGYESVSACIQPESGREVQRYGQRGLLVDTSIYFSGSADAQADDVVEDLDNGRKYIVIAPADEAEQARVSWFLCRRLN